ncbi:hypothetical protein CKAH01_09050 [Colletotrichum kahawae]|uniref:Uncharacterized protein n=1 Tax=Colletotrichum kahawae TaxID=34407 RepID=A0AAE0CYX2_COLKA|nr:hypothetical protein CKAH01_09050 [Colletotrichum kahawae]
MAPDKLNATQSISRRVTTHHRHSFKRQPHALMPQTGGHRIVYLGPPIYVRKLPVMEPRYYGPNTDLRALQKLKPRFLAIPGKANTRHTHHILRRDPIANSPSPSAQGNGEDESISSLNSTVDRTAEGSASSHLEEKDSSRGSTPNVQK